MIVSGLSFKTPKGNSYQVSYKYHIYKTISATKEETQVILRLHKQPHLYLSIYSTDHLKTKSSETIRSDPAIVMFNFEIDELGDI
jgi:hypothetical protein